MKNKNKVTVLIFAVLLGGMSLFCWFKPHTVYSESERRILAEKPDAKLSLIASGEYMKEFESYVTDQFPLRDKFRSVKALFSKYVFNKKDNNGLYVAQGHISKLEYPENPQMVDYAEQRFNYIYDAYLKDKDVNIYLSLIPDKNYFLAQKYGYPSIDYDSFINGFKNKMGYMKYIDISNMLSVDDYYKTDSHWKQEEIADVAQYISHSMGSNAVSEYEVNTLDNPFNGVFSGQAALPFKPDTIKYLTNDVLRQCKVKYFDTGKAVSGEMYNMEKAYGKCITWKKHMGKIRMKCFFRELRH